MKKLSMLEFPIVAVLLLLGLYMAMTGYQQVNTYMEHGKNQPFKTNFKYADKVIAAKLLTAKPTIDPLSIKVDQTVFEKAYLSNFTYMTELYDVTIGKDMDGHITEGKTHAIIKSHYDDLKKQYVLYGTFTGMPKLREGYYYEGWLVRKEPNFSIISTGKVVLIDEEFTSVYVSVTNLSDYDYFVVTLEHNDGDPKPEVEILEGQFTKI